MSVQQDHVYDLPDDGDLVEPVILAADVEQHLLQIHRIVYPNGYRQAQKGSYLLVGQREGQQHQQPDAQVHQPPRFAEVPCYVGSVKRISQQEGQQHSGVKPVRPRHELLEGHLEDDIEEDEVIDDEDEETPQCLTQVPQPLLAVHEPDHYKQIQPKRQADKKQANYQDYAEIDIISQLMESNNWKDKAESAETELAKQIEASKEIELGVKEAIKCIGNQHRYQVILIIYLILCFILSTYLLIGSSYFFMNPEFKCNGQSLTEKEACELPADECVLENDYTITSYVGLYCSKSAEREGIQAMLGIGACLGVLFINIVSDYKGRKFSFLCSLISGFLSVSLMVVGAYTGAVWIFFGSQILAAFCGNSIFTLVYVMSDRLMSKKYSNYCIIITNGFFALSQASLALFTGFMTWQQLSIGFMLVPSVLLIIASRFLIIQDPAFLFTKARFEQCKHSLYTIAAFNRNQDKIDESYGKLDSLIKNHVDIEAASKGTDMGQRLKYLHLLLKREVLLPMVMIGVFNLGSNINYYAFNYAISGIGYSYSVEIVLFGLVEFIGVFPMMFMGNKTPRKAGLLALIAMQIVISMLFIMSMSKTTETVLVVLVRFMLVNQYMLYIYLVVESFPQHIQATSFGIIEFIGQMGKLIAPYTINLSTALDISPILLTGIVSIIFQIATLLPLRETLTTHKQQPAQSQHIRQSLLEADGETASQAEFE